VLARRVHVEPLELRLLVDDDEVHVVLAAQAVVATESRQFASGGRYTRATVPFFDTMVSMKPGPWWLKPLWSLRQQVDVRR
jgi:hypothetical protein